MTRREAGFSLLEVAIAGAILMGGLVVLTQMTRSTLDTTAPGTIDGLQVGTVVDHQMKLHATHFKGLNKSGTNTSNRVRIGPNCIYTVAGTRSYVLPPAVGFGNVTYAVTEVEVTAKLTTNATDSPSVGDPTVGFTRFWKLDALSAGAARAGL